jgi:hypothetical protein
MILPGSRQPEAASQNKASGTSYPPPARVAVSGRVYAPREEDWLGAQKQAGLCEQFLQLTGAPHCYTVTGAARALGCSPAMFSGANSVLTRYRRGGVAALLPERREPSAGSVSELTTWIESLGWFIRAAKYFYTITNRANGLGSVPEAVRRTVSLPHLPAGWSQDTRRRFALMLAEWAGPANELPACPTALRDAILAREKVGLQLVPQRIARQITVAKVIVRQHRHPTNAALEFLNASGSLFFITDRLTGERRPPLVGEVIEADDATINFPVCVPWTLGGDPCSDRWGVKVGRFQWLVSVCAARRYVTAYTYVMRPRSSYRAEDALCLMRAHCLQHGIPAQWRFERGVWKSKLVCHAVAGLGTELHTVWSPHQKPYIEGLFNTLWTKLSVHFPDADVGRYQGETEAAHDLLVACQRGQRDPRRHFPMLATVMDAFREAVEEKNRTPVQSDIGRWIPAEAWHAPDGRRHPKRALSADANWLFSTYVREWTVKGMLVGGRVPLFEDLSVPFDFTAPWLADYDGARVRCHFDPTAPRCHAMLVLLDRRGGRRSGEVLGLAQQINEVTGYARMVLGWGDDPAEAGRLARQQAAAGLRRETRSVGLPGRQTFASSEERDGVNQVSRIERESAKAGPVSIDTEREAAAETFERNHALDFY